MHSGSLIEDSCVKGRVKYLRGISGRVYRWVKSLSMLGEVLLGSGFLELGQILQ